MRQRPRLQWVQRVVLDEDPSPFKLKRMVHSTLEFLIEHNVGIIQTLFGFLFLLLIALILKSFKEEKAPVINRTSVAKEKRERAQAVAAEKTDPPMEASPLDDLDNLDDLIGPEGTNADTAPAPAVTSSAPGNAGASPTVSAEQKAELDKVLGEKEKVIADLKNEIASLQEKAKSATPSAELEFNLKELTEKLAEYEIIEEDIANLSFYKNENVRLKDELEKLKGSSAVTPATAALAPETAPPSPAPSPAAPIEPEGIAAEAVVAVPAAPAVVEEPVAAPTAPPAAAATPVEESSSPSAPTAVMDEFEKAIQQKEVLESSVPVSAPETPGIDADILKEFENVVQKEWGEKKEEASIEPVAESAAPAQASTPASEIPAEAVVEAPAATEEIDTSKLISEVEELAKTEVKEDADVPENEEESKQKLIAEFENFINKAQ